MDLGLYLAPLRKWWWLLLISVALAVGASYYMVGQQPPRFQATATLIVGQAFEDPNPSGGELNLGSQLAQTYADLARRQQVREQTMAALGLNSLPSYFPRPVPNSQFLEIIVSDTDPQRAQLVANELANQVILQSPTAPGPEEQERQAFVESQLASLQSRIEETQAEILEKQNELDAAFSAREIADLGQEIAALQSKLNTLQGNYGNLLSSTSEGAVNTVSIFEPASLPRRSSGPDGTRTVLSAAAIALALAISTAYLLEYLDDTVKNDDDVARYTGLPPLPGIPEYKSDGGSNSVMALEYPRDPVADAFRALRAVVQTKTKQEKAKILLVSGVIPDEGKSSIAANLAVVMAQGDRSVLLIDADLRRATQHKLFDLSRNPGLSNLLLDYGLNGKGNELRALLERTIQSSTQKNLSIMVGGNGKANGPQLLGLETMGKMLDVVSRRYDYIIIDSPPLLAAPDALVMSAQATAVILVTLAGKTRRKDLQQAAKQLEEVGANVLGVVLNRVEASGGAYYYRYYDYYQKAEDSREKEDLELVHQNGKKSQN